jgi:hypothetical protein
MEDGNYQTNLIVEYPISNLENEIKDKKKNGHSFRPKELAYILKCVFKALLELHLKNLEHGNLTPFNVVFLENGTTKI